MIILFSLTGLFAPFIAPFPYWIQNLADSLQPPSWEHVFGTDRFGRDIFSRVIYGARTSLICALGAAGVAGAIGIFVGLIAGYFGGWTDRFVQGLIDISWSFPTLLLAIALAVVMKPGLISVVIAIAAGWWSQYARVVRGEVLSTREMDFVQAAKALGSSNIRIIFREIFPNIIPVIVVLISVTMGTAIIVEATLSFLGIGVQPPTPSWGIVLAKVRDFIARASWICLFPGVAISITVLAFNLLGDGLRDLLDPYMKRGRR